MATLKLTIDKRRAYQDGRYPVVFRLTSLQKSTTISTGIKLHSQEWDNRKSKVTKVHPDHKSLNLYLRKRTLELEKKLMDQCFQSTDIEVSELKEILLNSNEKKKISCTFLEFASKEIQLLKDQNRYGNARSYETAVKRLLKFTGTEIMLDKINYSIIMDFDAHLSKAGLSRNSISVYMREIRALMNRAINKELLSRDKYPFSRYKIRTIKTMSRAITLHDLQTIKQYPLLPDITMWHSRNIFFLIFNLIGISFIDLALLTSTPIQFTRLSKLVI